MDEKVKEKAVDEMVEDEAVEDRLWSNRCPSVFGSCRV